MNHLKTHQTNPTTAQYRPVQSNTSIAQYSQVQPIPEPDPKPELFGQTRPEPDPKSKSPTRQTLATTTSQPINRAPNESAMVRNAKFGPNLVVSGQKILFLLEKSKVLLLT